MVPPHGCSKDDSFWLSFALHYLISSINPLDSKTAIIQCLLVLGYTVLQEMRAALGLPSVQGFLKFDKVRKRPTSRCIYCPAHSPTVYNGQDWDKPKLEMEVNAGVPHGWQAPKHRHMNQQNRMENKK